MFSFTNMGFITIFIADILFILDYFNCINERSLKLMCTQVIMQGKLFQRCTHLLYCSVLSPGSNVNTSRMSQPDMRSIFHIKKSMKYSGHRKLSCALSKLSKFNAFNPLLDTKQTRMHLILLTYSTQRELVSICTQIIHTIEISFPCIIAMNFCHNFQISYYLERAKLNKHFG